MGPSPADPSDDLTRSFVRLTNLPTCPLDRLSRYEATLWRQACQILFTLQCLDLSTATNRGKDEGSLSAACPDARPHLTDSASTVQHAPWSIMTSASRDART